MSEEVKFSAAWLDAWCTRDPDTHCLKWTGQVAGRGDRPVTWARGEDGKRRLVRVRREVWVRRHGPIPPGMQVAVSCQCKRCLEHLELVDRSELMRRQWARTEVRATRTAALTKINRDLRGKISMEQVHYVRESSATLKELSEELGISKSQLSLIRRGEAWRDGANPFAGLGA